MSTYADFLVNHAYKYLWSGPRQDTQHLVSPSRVTARRGALGRVRIGMAEYTLPTASDWYSIFVFGDIPAFMVGMKSYMNSWVSAEAHCNSSNLLMTVYNENGITYPLFETYFLYTPNGQVILALKHIDKGFAVNRYRVYIKYRTGDWFSDVNNLVNGEGTRVKGRVAVNINDINIMSSLGRTWRERTGHVWAYVNGRRVRHIHPSTVTTGDYMEIVWDGSVREVIEFKLSDLKTFDSIKDLKPKYLLPQTGYGLTFDYVDDVELSMLSYSAPAVYDGVYFHQNQPDSVRNVTHRDFAVPTAYVEGIKTSNVRWNIAEDIRIELAIRHGHAGKDIPLLHDRLHELFLLPHELRIDAMLGESALVPEWTVANLENSDFNKVSSTQCGKMEHALVESSYGYNVTSIEASKVIYTVQVGQSNIILSKMLQYRSTVYEYDGTGKMLGCHLHSLTPEYSIKHPATRLIEVYFGHGGSNMGTIFGKNIVEMDGVSEYRCYVAYKSTSKVTGPWIDVTGDDTRYTTVDNRIEWLVDHGMWLTAVRKDCDFLAGDITLERQDRLLLMSIQTDNLYQDRQELRGWLEIPPGEFDVFLNGYLMVEHIDYHVQWPELCIVNTSRRVEGIYQQIHVRARGFCNSDLTRPLPKDYGFVYNHKVLNRSRYHSLDDKNNVLHVAGRLLKYDTAVGPANGRFELPEALNGVPYQIRNPVTPLKALVYTPTSEYRQRSIEMDHRVEDYLTLKLGIADTELPRTSRDYYVVVSPFMSKLLHDLLNGIFPIDEFKEDYSLQLLDDRLARYDYLLPYEPSVREEFSQFITTHPHPYRRPVEVNVYQYRILDRACTLKMNDRVLLDRSMLIIEEGYEHDTRYHPHPRRKEV